jgi:hypothetical protein
MELLMIAVIRHESSKSEIILINRILLSIKVCE